MGFIFMTSFYKKSALSYRQIFHLFVLFFQVIDRKRLLLLFPKELSDVAYSFSDHGIILFMYDEDGKSKQWILDRIAVNLRDASP